MGYLIKSSVIDALEEDMGDTIMCYEGKREKDIIAFCYESMERTIESLPQYRVDNVVEDSDLTPEQIMELKHRDTEEEILETQFYGMISYECPICNEPVHEKDNFCCKCGQRLKRKEDS